MNKIGFILVMAVLLAGCSDEYIAEYLTAEQNDETQIHKSVADFDGKVSYNLWPVDVLYQAEWSRQSAFEIGLYWKEGWGDELLLTVRISEIENINKLSFNVDGRIYNLKTNQIFTKFDDWGDNSPVTSRKSFDIDVDFLQKVVAAESVKVRLVTSEGYTDADFKLETYGGVAVSKAQLGFRKFLQTLEGESGS